MSVFTPEQVKSLNEYQQAGVMHPFTCGGDAKHLDGEGILVATEDGWICPYCDYKQNWAHGFMMDDSWKSRIASMAMQLMTTAKPEDR